MRRAPRASTIQPPATLHVDLAERLRVTAARLQAMPPELATSLSITMGWHDRSESEVRALATTIAEPLGFTPAVEGRGDSVTVIFRRSGQRHR
jgi:hypothetical protein